MNIDDVGFITALVDALSQAYDIDEQRIYVAGSSNGAILAHRMACERSDRIAAFAAVIGTFPAAIESQCDPTDPISAIMIFSDLDPLVPYDGGEIEAGRGGFVLSVPGTVAHWAAANGCATPPVITEVPDRDPLDGTRVRREAYETCDGGSSVVAYIVEGGGHTWPSGPGGIVTFRGPVSRDIDATELIWDFFEAHPKK